MLETRPTKFADVYVIVPDVFADGRGFFKETFSQAKYDEIGAAGPFVQDNVSFSRKGVLRGMHYASGMAKLVQCLSGSIFDVFVDMREGSPTYKQWDAVTLTGDDHLQVYIPAGYAHGFYVPGESALVFYKQSTPYDPSLERALAWNDPSVGIEWPLGGEEPLLSAKDAAV